MAWTPFWKDMTCETKRMKMTRKMRNVPNRLHYTGAQELLPHNVWVQLRSKHIWMERECCNNFIDTIRITSIDPTKYCHSMTTWEPAALWMNPMVRKQHQRQAEDRPMMTDSCNLQVELKGQKPTWQDIDARGKSNKLNIVPKRPTVRITILPLQVV